MKDHPYYSVSMPKSYRDQVYGIIKHEIISGLSCDDPNFETYLATTNLSKSTINVMSHVASLLVGKPVKYSWKNISIARTDKIGVPSKEENTTVRVLFPEDITKVLRNIEENTTVPEIVRLRNAAIVSFIYATGGRRPSELVKIKLSDIRKDSEKKIYTIFMGSGKSHKSLITELAWAPDSFSSYLYEVFDRYIEYLKTIPEIESNSYLFYNYRREPGKFAFTSDGINNLFRDLAGKEAGRAARRGAIGNVYENSGIEVAQAMAGHSSPQTTGRYVQHAIKGQFEKAHRDGQSILFHKNTHQQKKERK